MEACMGYVFVVIYLLIGIFVFSGWISNENKTPTGTKVLISLVWPIYLAIRIVVFIAILIAGLFIQGR